MALVYSLNETFSIAKILQDYMRSFGIWGHFFKEFFHIWEICKEFCQFLGNLLVVLRTFLLTVFFQGVSGKACMQKKM